MAVNRGSEMRRCLNMKANFDDLIIDKSLKSQMKFMLLGQTHT